MPIHAPEALAQATVRTPAGDAVAVAELWSRRPVVLVLVRHFG